MARRIMIAGNWKMNKTVAEALTLIEGLKQHTDKMEGVDVVVCPPYTSLSAVAEATANTPIAVGAQNIHWEESGAYTGEIAPSMLTEIPVEYAIVGHSERRQYFGETDKTVNKRIGAALKAGLTPIVCIGESLQQRESNQTQDVVAQQVDADFAGMTAEQMQRCIIAYEPIWAIGTGLTATPEQAQEVHAFVRGKIRDHYDGNVAEQVRILYGGSMKPDNAADLLGQADIDGGLVGGASLKPDAFVGIIEFAR